MATETSFIAGLCGLCLAISTVAFAVFVAYLSIADPPSTTVVGGIIAATAAVTIVGSWTWVDINVA